MQSLVADSCNMLACEPQVVTVQPWVRWLSDASYWVYLTHLPLVIAMQAVLVDHDLPAAGKVLIVFSVTAATTLLTYRWCVRYTLIGLLLNGPRSRLGQLP